MKLTVQEIIAQVLWENGVRQPDEQHKIIATEICEKLKRNLLETDERELTVLDALIIYRHKLIDALAVYASDEEHCKKINTNLKKVEELEKKLKGR
jgi:hypothetical protein